MMAPDSIVFVIDDDASVRKALSRLLRSAGHKTEAFASASEFLARPACSEPCCAVVDVRMPGLNGIELQAALTQRRRPVELIFVTGHGDIPTCAQAMKSGAVDFLTKPIKSERLLGCVERALRRAADERERRLERDAARRLLDLLTPREFEVMQLVITGMLNKQIAAALNTAEKTVKVHRGRVMHKLGVVSVPDLLRTTRQAGVLA